MYATVTTWHLPDSLRDREARDRFVRSLVLAGIEKARQAGVIDVIMIEVEPDQLVAVSVFETLADADAAAPVARQFLAERYDDTLALVSRVTGRAYDPHGLVPITREAVQQWRGDVDAMTASLVTWRLDPSLRAPEALGDYLHGLWERYLGKLQPLGLFDVLVVRVADDTILAVRLYAEPVEGEAPYQEAVAGVQDLLDGHVAFVEKRAGRAFDIPQMLARSSDHVTAGG